MKKICIVLLVFLSVMGLSACGKGTSDGKKQTDQTKINPPSASVEQKDPDGKEEGKTAEEPETSEMPKTIETFLDGSGKTLETRIHVPGGFQRIPVKSGSLGSFLRNYKMKKDGSPVLLYDGSEKGNQEAHIAVFKLPLEREDLQQCADTVMCVYGEYYYRKGAYDKISFSLGSGFRANFGKWSRGYGISVNGNSVSWIASSGHDTSYASFKKFMRIVFAYSGTLNLEEDSKKISLGKLRIGDMFIKGGSPGHVVMVVDVCKNADGKKAFLLAQGYMPAQEFHVLKNPLHEDDPWYYEEEVSYPFETPEYSFDKGSLRRPAVAW